jgi:tetratricopeptide (TPR) repeat protein
MRRLSVFDLTALWGGILLVTSLSSSGCRRPGASFERAAPGAGVTAPASAGRDPAAAPGAVAAASAPSSASSSTSAATATGAPGKASNAEPPPRPLRRCFPDTPSWVDAPVAALLDRAAEMFETSDYEGALACAEEAARQAPRSVEAHHNRAVALLHLDRLDDARDALALALALAPDDPETLEAAADLNINQLAPSADRSQIGLEYARRGSRHVSRHDSERVARLALLEGQALVDLGRSLEGLHRIDAALAAMPKMTAAQYERGVALFELCRFHEARHMFQKVLATTPDHGHALYHLGLIEERVGSDSLAAQRLAEATAHDPKAFPAPPSISPEQFQERVRHAVTSLPPDVAADLSGIQVQAAELPALDDLTAEKPPLSPTILGLFRGLPLDWKADSAPPTQAGRVGSSGRGKKARRPLASDKTDDKSDPGVIRTSDGARCAVPDRAIVLYRRNLLRTVADQAELDRAILRTLLHEVGHLRGEDDGSLRDRGLE